MNSAVTQTYEKVPFATGKIGVWLFLAGEVTIFGGIIASFVLLRLHHPEWIEHAAHTLKWAGTINTLILLTSSLTMVLAHSRAHHRDLPGARRMLALTLGLGVLFLGIKGVEYYHEIVAGHSPAENLFWGYYFFMTGLHALHIIIGLVIMACFMVMIESQRERVEYLGLYWHLVDIVWIFLFPLLYLGA